MGRRCGGRGGGVVVVVVAAWWCWGAKSGLAAGGRRPVGGPRGTRRRHHLRENPRRPGPHPLTATGAPSGGGEGGAADGRIATDQSRSQRRKGSDRHPHMAEESTIGEICNESRSSPMDTSNGSASGTT